MGMKAEQWRQIILSFESKKTYDNPFLDVSIWSIFTGPSGRRIRREAYWDGGNTYRIAFAPTETGMWSYRLEAPEETGLSGVQGTIECIPYEGDLAIYRHGFLKVHPSGRYLTYADGTPFFWLGDTHWAFAFGERWDESNHPQMTSMFRGMADRRKEQGYNVYQTNLRSDSWKEHKSRYWKTDATDDVPDVAFYQNELDRRMQYLADLGFINALGFAWSGSIEQGVEHQKHLARYIIVMEGVSVRYVTSVQEIHHPDAIILPGSKNTMGDLKWMRENGMEAMIKKLSADTPVIGICGGYQMLGESLEDPYSVEEGGSLRGMELLPLKTMMSQEKVRRQVTGTIDPLTGMLASLSGKEYKGYEIHMGHTAQEKSSTQDAVVVQKGNVYGTYVHGIFDEGDIASTFIRALAEKKGVHYEDNQGMNYQQYKESQYDLLADTLRKYLDMEAVYGMLQEAEYDKSRIG